MPVGALFRRFEAAWNAWTYPSKGLPWHERWRLAKLAHRGQRIADPVDAERVRKFVSWARGPCTRMVVVLGIAGCVWALVMASLPNRSDHRFWLTLAALFVLSVLGQTYERQRQSRTSRANGWGTEPLFSMTTAIAAVTAVALVSGVLVALIVVAGR